MCDVLYHFAWDEVCDWYLELAKVPLGGDDPHAAETTRQVLGFVLDQLMRLLHPVMPFVTDELWTALTHEDSVMVAPWPAFTFADPAAEAEISSLMRLVTEVRRFRSDQGLRPGQRVAPRRAVDVAPERRRMEKDLAAACGEAEQSERKLANPDFTAKAPAAVVDKTRQR